MLRIKLTLSEKSFLPGTCHFRITLVCCSVPSNFYPIHRVNLKDEENIDCKTMFSVKNGEVNKVFSAQCLGLVHFAYFFFL